MADESRHDVERRLREIFEPSPDAVGRVRDAALAEPQRRRGGWRPALAVAAILMGLAAVLVLWRGPEAPVSPASTEVLAGTLSEGLLVVQLPDGSTSITGGPAREGRSPEGSGVVLVEGDFR